MSHPTGKPLVSQAAKAQPADTASSGVVDAARGAQDAIKQTAQETIGTASQAARDLVDHTSQQASDVVAQAADQVAQAVGGAKQQVTSAFVEQRDQAIAGLTGLADALRKAGEQLGTTTTEGAAIPGALAPIVRDAADYLAHSADFLHDKDVTSLLKDARDLAQRQPLLFIGTMFAAGLAGARLLKATTDESQTSDDLTPPPAMGSSDARGEGIVTGDHA